MEIIVQNINYQDWNLDFCLPDASIVGITGEGKSLVSKIISFQIIGMGTWIENGEKIENENLCKIAKKISCVSRDLYYYPYLRTVKEYMNEIIKYNKLQIRDPDKKERDSLKIVNLPSSYLERELFTLSSSEKKLVQIAMSLLSNPEIIVFDEPFLNLDLHQEKKFYMLITRLKEQYHKTIVLATNNSNLLYKYTTDMLFLKKHRVFFYGPTSDVYLRVSYLTKNKFEVPDIVNFTYKAKKKYQVKIDYHKDIRDIIKDIYKHI